MLPSTYLKRTFIMASIRKKTNGMWFAQVRHRATDGLPAINRSASFPRKTEAEAWANKIETEWRTMRFGGCPNIPFAEVLLRYQKEISVKNAAISMKPIYLRGF